MEPLHSKEEEAWVYRGQRGARGRGGRQRKYCNIRHGLWTWTMDYGLELLMEYCDWNDFGLLDYSRSMFRNVK
jgi:hypothetical protein